MIFLNNFVNFISNNYFYFHTKKAPRNGVIKNIKICNCWHLTFAIPAGFLKTLFLLLLFSLLKTYQFLERKSNIDFRYVYYNNQIMWKKEYEKKKFYWGLKPDVILKQSLKYVRRGRAIDLGAGEGRNSIFLAKNGLIVEAIDADKRGLKKCKNLAEKYNLPIETKVYDIRDFKFKRDYYSLVVGINVFDFIKFSETKKIFNKIRTSLKNNGIFIFTVFSTKDPAFLKYTKNEPIEKNTFYISKLNLIRHFFTPEDMEKLLKEFNVLYLKQIKIKDVSHGEPHIHDIIKSVIKKRG